jgi:hypothetical protein
MPERKRTQAQAIANAITAVKMRVVKELLPAESL